MNSVEIVEQFIQGLQNTTAPEFIAVIAGIVSVWFSRKERIWVYPIGLINTLIYIVLSIRAHLPGEMTVNLYYTIMSLYGWYQWSKTDTSHHAVMQITVSDSKWWLRQILFFLASYLLLFVALRFLQKAFFPGAIPWADALASASAFTGMWLMTRKKLESWYWWMLTNISSIPLYFVKQYVFTSVYYLILLVMAVAGLFEWRRRIHLNRNINSSAL